MACRSSKGIEGTGSRFHLKTSLSQQNQKQRNKQMIYCPSCKIGEITMNPEGDYGRCNTCNQLLPLSFIQNGMPADAPKISGMINADGRTIEQVKADDEAYRRAAENSAIEDMNAKLIFTAIMSYDPVTAEIEDNLKLLALAHGPTALSNALVGVYQNRAIQFKDRGDALNYVRFLDAANILKSTVIQLARSHGSSVSK